MENNLFKNSAILLKNNLMVIQPLFLGMLAIMFVLMPLSDKKSLDFSFIFSLVIAGLCLTAFLSGWYNCVKYTISLKNKTYSSVEEKNKTQIEILKNFVPGVGEYMLPVSVMFLIYAGIGYGIFELYKIFIHKTVFYQTLPKDFLNILATSTQTELAEYIKNNFSLEQMQEFVKLMLGGMGLFFIFNFFVLWFAPAVYYSSKNPFKALFHALKFSFKNIFMSFLIIFVMFLINMLLSGFNVLLTNPFLAFIPMLLSFLYVMYYVITVFLYYETKTQNHISYRA